jgi:sugar transferase (PEP-CTERM/EpsH1 system associated)
MARLLFLPHRLPYPPNKGDKVRSFHLLQHLAERHEVHVGTFVDDPDDEVHLPALRKMVAGLHVERLHPRRARVASLAGLLTGRALSLHYYRSAGLSRWVEATLAQQKFDAAVAFSSVMVQYVQHHRELPLLVDLVDVDSAKWADYAPQNRWPLSWLYALEGRRLLAYERAVTAGACCTFLATQKETELFSRLAPETAGRVLSMNNGVDAHYFAPDAARLTPFLADETPLVFTGAMDYWPNVDAVSWFVQDVLPLLRAARPRLRLHIVGRSPTPAVRALAGDAVSVSGTVPDVRPYLQHAAVVVAPLRLARGIQNKILEAMAMARPVVAAATCVEALHALAGSEILPAVEAQDYACAIDSLLGSPERAAAVGLAGRRRVLESYSWRAHLALIDRHLPAGAAA